MDRRLTNVIGTVRRADLRDWAREVARIIADKGDEESLQLFRDLTVRSALFLYLNYDTTIDAAYTLMDRNYMDIDENVGDIVAVYSDNNEDYYALLRNLHTVALDGSSDQDIYRIVQNKNVAEIYLDADLALNEYEGDTFLRDLPTMPGFTQELGYPFDEEINYWRYRG